MGKVTGIGGVFIVGHNKEESEDWYAKNLGIESGKYGTHFEWRDTDNPNHKKLTAWNIFPKDTTYFNPDQKHMINYRVDNMEEILATCKTNGVKIIGGPDSFEYGKFAWIEDPNGYRVELWEPIDEPLLNFNED